MKIKTASGKILDTNKLSDKEADITEAINNLYKVCKKYNSTVFARAIINKDKYIGAINISKSPKNREEEIVFLLGLLAGYIHETTGGQYQVVRVESSSEN